MWIWRRMARVKWTDRVRNEAVLGKVGEERMMLKLIRKRKRNWLADLYRHWGWEVLFHLPYSPDLSPCGYDFIPKMKDRSLGNINRTGTATEILRLPHRWKRVVDNTVINHDQENYEKSQSDWPATGLELWTTRIRI
ncbi:hypothetical protein ANN_15772 [Periplaneta americana]|uniref:Uncharacterized protein n=1 Tax=Periplaneta americana TaxID=6978 RepID=A0ABQ8SH54_PERAM|nr:hypothetical protein ANN_15772 [Periplaneta americana]